MKKDGNKKTVKTFSWNPRVLEKIKEDSKKRNLPESWIANDIVEQHYKLR